jgi:site-specific DNA-methyltransferase (adenine-specific)
MCSILNIKKIELNSMTDTINIAYNITEMDLTNLSKPELLAKCQEIGILKCKSKNREALIELINNHKPKTQKKKLIIEKDDESKDADECKDENKIITPQNDNIVILNADCMVELNKLADNSIDCVITDPPYFIDKLDNKWSSNQVNSDVKNSHIKHLPKGMKFDKSQVKNLYDYYLELSKLLFKKMKPGAYFLSFSSPRLYHAIAMSCEIAGFEIRDMINWTYTQSMPKGMSISHIIEKMNLTEEEKSKLIDEYKDYKTPQIRSCFEPICVAMKPIGKLTFIQNELQFKTGLLDFSQKVGIDNDRVPANIITTEEYNESYDKNFLVSKPSKTEKGENNTHITVKPLALIEHLIKLFSKKGSLVVDPFLGSGTTALACKNTDRKCFGTELNSEYYEICLDRCK